MLHISQRLSELEYGPFRGIESDKHIQNFASIRKALIPIKIQFISVHPIAKQIIIFPALTRNAVFQRVMKDYRIAHTPYGSNISDAQ